MVTGTTQVLFAIHSVNYWLGPVSTAWAWRPRTSSWEFVIVNSLSFAAPGDSYPCPYKSQVHHLFRDLKMCLLSSAGPSRFFPNPINLPLSLFRWAIRDLRSQEDALEHVNYLLTRLFNRNSEDPRDLGLCRSDVCGQWMCSPVTAPGKHSRVSMKVSDKILVFSWVLDLCNNWKYLQVCHCQRIETELFFKRKLV